MNKRAITGFTVNPIHDGITASSAPIQPYSPTNRPTNDTRISSYPSSTSPRSTHLDINCQMRQRMHLLIRHRARPIRPLRRRLDVRPRVKREAREALKQPDEEEARFVVGELLAEADARTAVEGTEDEWV